MRKCLIVLTMLAMPAAALAQNPHGNPHGAGAQNPHGTTSPARPGAMSPSNYRPTPATRDADCFLIAAVGSQNIMANNAMSEEARMMEPILRGTAAYFAGRLATRLNGAPLRQALAASSDVVRSPALRDLLGSCTGEFQAFMRSVAAPDAGATPG